MQFKSCASIFSYHALQFVSWNCLLHTAKAEYSRPGSILCFPRRQRLTTAMVSASISSQLILSHSEGQCMQFKSYASMFSYAVECNSSRLAHARLFVSWNCLLHIVKAEYSRLGSNLCFPRRRRLTAAMVSASISSQPILSHRLSLSLARAAQDCISHS